MDDLFRRANKYSMLEDDVRAATQQVLVAGRPSRGDAEEMLNLRIGQSRLTEGRKGQWPRPKEQTHPQGIVARDVSSTRIMVIQQRHAGASSSGRKLIKAGHLKQYLRSDTGRKTFPTSQPGAPGPQLPPRPL
ncbi:hypothetical protein CK203_028428 [Vitis vinifera]|uniref:Uncharacterized protein n=1 Tax=Vitis vinifera TaxID=29760 RepID=A0A438J068_VITVI|nr:hypothetical protein CK203_028428 [Vitis vinifera]